MGFFQGWIGKQILTEGARRFVSIQKVAIFAPFCIGGRANEAFFAQNSLFQSKPATARCAVSTETFSAASGEPTCAEILRKGCKAHRRCMAFVGLREKALDHKPDKATGKTGALVCSINSFAQGANGLSAPSLSMFCSGKVTTKSPAASAALICCSNRSRLLLSAKLMRGVMRPSGRTA